jgi:hypothetical protein
VGFAFGVERLDRVMQALEIPRAPDRESQGGCLVVAATAHVAEAASLVTDLRRIASGAWEDGGPIVGPEVLDVPDQAAIDCNLSRAMQQGRSTLILVAGRRIDPEKVRWFRRDAGGWVEEPGRPAILLATLANARKGGGLA